jgi:anti-anti-sigma factor
MEVKTDTKEKFHVIRVETLELTANMAAELNRSLIELLKGTIKNVVLNLGNVKSMPVESAEILVRAQQRFYDTEASFVVCELSPELEEYLDEQQLLELMNVTPSESEAFDIVQMEEIERELLNDEED